MSPTIMPASFNNARLKIRRANKHINDLDAVINNYLSRKPYRYVTDRKGREASVVIAMEPLPNDENGVAVLFGDAVHNLRAALDLMYCDIIRHFNGDVKHSDQFVRKNETRKEVEARFNSRLKPLSPQFGPTIIDYIVNTIRPYEGGNDSVLAMHELDISDKHHAIIPIITLHGPMSVTVEARGNTTSIRGGADFVNAITVVLGDENVVEVEVTEDLEPSFDVLIDEGRFARKPVIPTLQQLSKLVLGFVEELEKKIPVPRTAVRVPVGAKKISRLKLR